MQQQVRGIWLKQPFEWVAVYFEAVGGNGCEAAFCRMWFHVLQVTPERSVGISPMV